MYKKVVISKYQAMFFFLFNHSDSLPTSKGLAICVKEKAVVEVKVSSLLTQQIWNAVATDLKSFTKMNEFCGKYMGVLPYISYMGMCCTLGYGFWG